MFRIIRASFNQRRKTLANGLKNDDDFAFSKEQIETAILTLGKGESIRGEQLLLSDFAQLSDIFSEMNS